MTDTTDALAAALHDGWCDPTESHDSIEPHNESARILLAALAASGWSLVPQPAPDPLRALIADFDAHLLDAVRLVEAIAAADPSNGHIPIWAREARASVMWCYGSTHRLRKAQPAPDPLREAALEAVQSEALPGNIHRRLEAALAAPARPVQE